MPDDLPIACSLTAAELPARLAEMAALGRESLLAVDAEETRAVLRFRTDASARLAAVVAAESECCAFLAISLRHERDAITLTIDAPSGGEPVLHELVAAFAPAIGAPRAPGLRAASALTGTGSRTSSG